MDNGLDKFATMGKMQKIGGKQITLTGSWTDLCNFPGQKLGASPTNYPLGHDLDSFNPDARL